MSGTGSNAPRAGRGVIKRDADEAMRLARNLARNTGYWVFPCRLDKRPGGDGWPERASTDSETIGKLWCDHPGPLVGIVCGERSGIDVLDLDRKYEEASAWYYAHRDRLPPTRTFRTRSGGAHLYFRHALGVRNSASKIAPGIDVRGEGGFIVAWFVAGLPCLDPSPPAPWPPWLLKLILPAPAPAQRPQHKPPRTTDAAIAGILQSVASAPEGQRNARLNWAAYRLGARVVAGELGRGEAEMLLAGAAAAAGLPKPETGATIASGLKGAGA